MSTPKSGPYDSSLSKIPGQSSVDSVILHPIQLDNLGIKSATVFYFNTTTITNVPNDGDTLILNDGITAAETFTFRTVPAGSGDVLIEANLSDQLITLAAVIVADGTNYTAAYVNNLQFQASSHPLLGKVVIIAAISPTPREYRIYGSINAVAFAKILDFTGAGSYGFGTGGNEPDLFLPAADPLVKQGFGPNISTPQIQRGEIRSTIVPRGVYSWSSEQPTAASGWRPLTLFQNVPLKITDTQQIDAVSGTLSVGQFEFDPNDYFWAGAAPDIQATLEFQVIWATSKGGITGSVSLYNLTDGETVTGTLVTTSSVAFALSVSSQLVPAAGAGSIKLTTKIYEVRLSTTGVDFTDIVFLGQARLAFRPLH